MFIKNIYLESCSLRTGFIFGLLSSPAFETSEKSLYILTTPVPCGGRIIESVYLHFHKKHADDRLAIFHPAALLEPANTIPKTVPRLKVDITRLPWGRWGRREAVSLSFDSMTLAMGFPAMAQCSVFAFPQII